MPQDELLAMTPSRSVDHSRPCLAPSGGGIPPEVTRQRRRCLAS